MTHQTSPHDEGDIVYPSAVPFVLAHLACFGVIWSGVSWTSAWLSIGLYWLRMFAVTGGYHRYFSHRTYKTSRVGQFLLALLLLKVEGEELPDFFLTEQAVFGGHHHFVVGQCLGVVAAFVELGQQLAGFKGARQVAALLAAG